MSEPVLVSNSNESSSEPRESKVTRKRQRAEIFQMAKKLTKEARELAKAKKVVFDSSSRIVSNSNEPSKLAFDMPKRQRVKISVNGKKQARKAKQARKLTKAKKVVFDSNTHIVSNSNESSKKPRESMSSIRQKKNAEFRKEDTAKKFVDSTRIDEDNRLFYLNIKRNVRQGLESIEDKVAVANNALERTRGQEIHLTSNRLVARVIKDLISFANPEHFERFLTAYSESFRLICSNDFTSQVMQKVVEVCFLRSVYYKKQDENDKEEPTIKKKRQDPTFEETYNMTQKFERPHREKCSEFIQKVGQFLLNNLKDLLWDPYANRIITSTIFSLVGTRAVRKANEEIQNLEVVVVPGAWIEIVNELVERLQTMPQFANLPYDELPSLTLGCCMIALRTYDRIALRNLESKIIIESFLTAGGGKNQSQIGSVALPMVFENENSSRLLEIMLCTAEYNIFSQLYAMLFMGRVSTVALKRHITVQKLIENIKQPTDFESVLEELHASIKEIIKIGHTGIVESLAKICLRFPATQKSFVSAILSALQTADPEQKFDWFFICILKMTTYEQAIALKPQYVNLHGSMTLQHMLEFDNPGKLVQSMLKVPAKDLALIFSTSRGSFVADTFIRSKAIGKKYRANLLEYLEGEYLRMAITEFGSRVVENLFQIANEEQKMKIAKELAEKSDQLNKTCFGRLVHDSLHIETYKLSVTE